MTPRLSSLGAIAPTRLTLWSVIPIAVIMLAFSGVLSVRLDTKRPA